MTQYTPEQLLALSSQGKLFGTMFRTLGGHNGHGRGLLGHGAGLSAVVESCPAGLAVSLDGAFKCVIPTGSPIHTDGHTIWWGAAIMLHVGGDAAPGSSMMRAPLCP